jgi:hypothetical protein
MRQGGHPTGARRLRVWGRKLYWLRYGKRMRRAKGGKSRKGNRK